MLNLREFIEATNNARSFMDTNAMYPGDVNKSAIQDAENRKKHAELMRTRQEAIERSERIAAGIMSKFASIKLKDRKDMPQVDTTKVKDDEDIPTGKLEFVKPDTLKHSQKTVNKTKVKSIASNWATVGKNPVLISKDNYILDGHHRVEAAKSIGKLVRAIRVDYNHTKALAIITKGEASYE